MSTSLTFLFLFILLHNIFALPANTWYNFSATGKKYLYHDECFIINQASAETICKTTHNGDNVASMPSSAARDWFINTLITTEPVNGPSVSCKTYNILSGSPAADRFITLGGNFIADNDMKKQHGGLIWWNGDTYDPSLFNWDTNEPNAKYSAEPGVFLAFAKHTIHDGAFNGDQAFGVLCEKTIPTSYPTINPTSNPTIDPSIDPTIDPTYDPTMHPTVDPIHDPTIHPSMDPTIYPTTDPIVDPTINPTSNPSIDPTMYPTSDPSNNPTMPPIYQYTDTYMLHLDVDDTNNLIVDIVNITTNTLGVLYGSDSNIQTNIISVHTVIVLSVTVNSNLDPDTINDKDIEDAITDGLENNNYNDVTVSVANGSTTEPPDSSTWQDMMYTNEYLAILIIIIIVLCGIICFTLWCLHRSMRSKNRAKQSADFIGCSSISVEMGEKESKINAVKQSSNHKMNVVNSDIGNEDNDEMYNKMTTPTLDGNTLAKDSDTDSDQNNSDDDLYQTTIQTKGECASTVQ